MRKLAWLVVCVAVAAAVLSFAPDAHAGEKNALGCIFVADGGSSNNATTGYNIANQNIRAFDIGTSSLITIQCLTGPCHVAVGEATTNSSRGLYLASLEKITSSTSTTKVQTTKADGGAYNNAIVSVAQSNPTSATPATVCVFERLGNE